MRTSIPRPLIAAMIACLVFCVLLALDLIPFLRGDFGWRWPYATPDIPRLLPAVIVVGIYIVGVSRITNTRLLLLWCFAGAVAIPVACLYLLGDPLYLLVTRTLSGQATGPHLAGAYISDLGAALRNWPNIMLTYLDPQQHIMISGHVALSPPGLPLVYYALDRLFEAVPVLADPLGMALRSFQCQNFGIMAYSNAQLASAWLGILMPVWAALTVFPLYRLGGRLAAVWWPLVPSVAMFATTWNTLYPLLGLVAFLLLAAGLRESEQGKRGRASVSIVASGIVLAAATFANISIVPLAGLFGFYVLIKFLQAGQYRQRFGSLIGVGLLFAAGLFSVWAIYYVASGVMPQTILVQALGQHLGYESERPYLPWLYLHLYDLLLFTGFPVVILCGVVIVRNIPVLRSVNWRAIDPMPLTLVLALIILDLSGTARGETGRVWLFFVPFILAVGARFFENARSNEKFSPGVAPLIQPGASAPGAVFVTLTQAITLLTLVAFLRVMDTELKPPPELPSNDQAAYDSLTAPATFDGSFTLIGERAVATDSGVDVTLAWKPDRQTAKPYYLSALVVKPDGQPLDKAQNWQPFDTRYPVTCWKPGQTIVETHHITMGSDAPPGDYWISLSAFDVRDVKGVPVTRPGTPPDTQVGLGPIPVGKSK